MKFCNKNGCDNILTSFVRNNNLIFQCNICLQEYNSSPDDTLLIDEYLKEDETLYKYQIYLKNAQNDNLTKLIYKDCTNKFCDETIIRVISIDKNGQSIYICPKCGNKFI